MPLDRKLETYSKAGISYLAGDVEELARFMNTAGYDPNGLRAALGSEELADAVIDYFAANENALLAMCANSDISVSSFMHFWQQRNSSE